MDIKKQLIQVFCENGLEITACDEDRVLELDSLRFISLLVSIEDAFGFEVPDDYLSNEILASFSDFYEMVLEQRSNMR